MSWLSRVLNVGRGRRVNAQLDDEFRFHIASRAEELMRQGMTADKAQEQAKRLFGNALVLRDSSRDIKMSARLESIVRDVRFGLRLFRKYPSVAAAAILSLSLTIGACTGAFSLINALILRPLPVADPQSLVYAVYRPPGDAEDSASFNYPLFERMRAASGAQIQLFDMSYSMRRDAVFDDAAGQSERIYAQWISGDAFTILGVRSALGRLLAASDDRTPSQHPVAVISYDFWQRRFGGNPAVLGRWVTVREKALQIIGVTEPGLRVELLDGRDLDWRDVRSGGDSAVVVNESFARRCFPGESAVGRKFCYVSGNNPPISQEIVGVVRDAKYASVRDAAPPTVYVPQWPAGWAELQLRTPVEPSVLASRLRETLPQVHSTLRLTDLTQQATLVDNVLVKERPAGSVVCILRCRVVGAGSAWGCTVSSTTVWCSALARLAYGSHWGHVAAQSLDSSSRSSGW
jgi:hypothetical protein